MSSELKIEMIRLNHELPPEQHAPFKKISRLGGGTYGRVYQATRETNTNEVVAIKRNFISPSLSNSVGSIRELDILNTVKGHPFCIQLKEVLYGSPFQDGSLSPADKDWVNDKVYFVLEKGQLDGDKYIHSNQPGLVNQRKLFAVQIFLAIEFLHSRGIYHRDLKPANIICFLDQTGLESAKITDFGLAQHYSHQTISSHGFVTLWYRAPEITLVQNYDHKVDVWSLGCILFELFSSGNRRFVQPDCEESLINLLVQRLDFPREFYTVAQQLFPKKITRTYETAQQTRKSIEEQLGFTPSQIAQFDSAKLGGRPNFGTFTQLADLLEKILVVDPENRWTASQCLNHPFFDGFRGLINRTRGQFGINHSGEWMTKPIPRLIYQSSSVRTTGMKWFQMVHLNRYSYPISNWYSDRIFFHALEMFDRYLCTLDLSKQEVHESNIVVWVNTFLFLSAKYFRVLVKDVGLSNFTIGIIPTEFYIFKSRTEDFEEHLVKEVFKGEIYRPTIYEVATEFLTEPAVTHLLKLTLNGEIPSGTSLRSFWSSQFEIVDQLNRNRSSPLNDETPVISII